MLPLSDSFFSVCGRYLGSNSNRTVIENLQPPLVNGGFLMLAGSACLLRSSNPATPRTL